MIISTSHNFAFLCTPKCASTSIEKAIGQEYEIAFKGRPKHTNIRQYDFAIRPMLGTLFPKSDIETFCLMREPIAWLSSWYRYLKRPALENPNHFSHRHYTGGLSFDEFVGYVTGEIPNTTSRFLPAKQSQFFMSQSQDIGVDHLFQMERIDLVQQFLSQKMGKNIKFDKLNDSPTAEFELGDEALRKLNEYFLKDYEIFERLKTSGHLSR